MQGGEPREPPYMSPPSPDWQMRKLRLPAEKDWLQEEVRVEWPWTLTIGPSDKRVDRGCFR
jgi:hypothetical protein